MVRTFEEIQKVLARNLKIERQKAKLSQEALAFGADVDRTYVSQIERAVGNPSIFVITKLAIYLNIDIQLLLN